MRPRFLLLALALLALPGSGAGREPWWTVAAVLDSEIPACTLVQGGQRYPRVSLQVHADGPPLARAYGGPFFATREGRWDGRLEIDGRAWRFEGKLEFTGFALHVPPARMPEILAALGQGRTARLVADRHGLVAEAPLAGVADVLPAFERCLRDLRAVSRGRPA